jgi:hypothetical protein
VFSEQVTATINNQYSVAIQYNSNDKDSYGFGSNFTQTYYYPYDITVTATSSILADNPVTINFGGIVSGSLAVSSNADLILGGPVLFDGSVSFEVNGSLWQQAAAVITAGSLSVNAVGGTVGSATQPLSLAMLNDGPVSATGTQGVYLASTGNLNVGSISTQTPASTSVPGNQLISGFNQNGTNWSKVTTGSFTPTIADNVMTLTQSGVESTANAWWYDTLLPVNQAFAVSFTYTGQASGADGVALVFQNSSSGTSAVGGSGSGVGYSGIAGSLALVLDIYSEDGVGGSGLSIATGGTIPTLTDTSPVALDTSHPINVLLSYDPVAQTVTVVLQDTVTSQQYTLVTPNIDLATLVGANNAYLGFTGGTGSVTSTQTISNFSWSSAAPVAVTTAAVTGFGTTGTGWTLTNGGGTAASVSNNVLTLTQSSDGYTANAAWSNTAVAIDQPFAVSYTYTGQANGADGVAFVLQNDPRGTAAVGTTGGGVGYADILHSVGVVLDIYSGDGVGGAGFQVATNGTLGTFQSTAPGGAQHRAPDRGGAGLQPADADPRRHPGRLGHGECLHHAAVGEPGADRGGQFGDPRLHRSDGRRHRDPDHFELPVPAAAIGGVQRWGVLDFGRHVGGRRPADTEQRRAAVHDGNRQLGHRAVVRQPAAGHQPVPGELHLHGSNHGG